MPLRLNSWFVPVFLIVILITGARIVLLAYSQADIFVDEAQYWLWGQHLDLGYYSKPPLIAWVIRATTELAGSNAPFWIRLPAPLFHGATALVLGCWAAQMFDAKAAFWVSVCYVTMPIVAVGSLLISTDTIMAPFFVVGLLFYFQHLKSTRLVDAILAGAFIGLAFMAKYAGVYFFLCAGLSAALLPGYRISLAGICALLAAFLLVASPNIIWNLTHDLTTLEHTLDNVEWVRETEPESRLHFGALSEFFFTQFVVMGPVLFATLLMLMLRAKTEQTRALLLFSLPIVALVCVQALLSRAYGNWAFAAYFAATLAVVPWLRTHAFSWLKVSLVVNLAFTLILPILTISANSVTLDGEKPLLVRYLGRDELSLQILDLAKENYPVSIVVSNRDVLADLFLTGHDAGIDIYSLAPTGRAANYYQQTFPFIPSENQTALLVTARKPVICNHEPISPLTRFDTAGGAYRNSNLRAYLLAPGCDGLSGID